MCCIPNASNKARFSMIRTKIPFYVSRIFMKFSFIIKEFTIESSSWMNNHVFPYYCLVCARQFTTNIIVHNATQCCVSFSLKVSTKLAMWRCQVMQLEISKMCQLPIFSPLAYHVQMWFCKKFSTIIKPSNQNA